MPLADVANIVVRLGASPIGLESFAVPMIAAVLSGPQEALWGSDLVREVTAGTWQSLMTTLGVSSSEDLYVALRTMFGQELTPALVLLGLRDTAVAQVVTYTIPASPANGDWTITIDGEDFTFAASTSTQAQVRDGLIALIDAGAGTLVDAAVGSSSTLTVTALAPGRPFTSSTASPASAMTQATTTPSVGPAEDLVAWREERDDFYVVMETTHDEDNVYAFALAIEANATPKMFMGQTNSAVAQTAGTTDIGNVLRLLGLARTAVFWHDDLDDFVEAAAIGRLITLNPGSATWANKEVRLVGGIVPTSVANLTTKNYTWLELYPSKDVSATRRGRVADGTPIDLIIALDFARDLLQTRIFNMELANDKIGYDEEGAAVIDGVMRGGLEELASDQYKIANASTIVLSVPTAASQSDEDRAERHYPNVNARFQATGAIETIGATVLVTE